MTSPSLPSSLRRMRGGTSREAKQPSQDTTKAEIQSERFWLRGKYAIINSMRSDLNFNVPMNFNVPSSQLGDHHERQEFLPMTLTAEIPHSVDSPHNRVK